MAEDINSIIQKILKETSGKSSPKEEHEIVYDSPSETLEPVYFWILDMMNNFFGGKVEKLVDNFSASPGSGYFSELSQKKTIMQKNVTETLGTVNTVIKSIVNIIYDLKDFEIRLEHYDATKSNDKNIVAAGNLALKQIWMDNVDIKRGTGSINALASGNLQFVTLRDGFMVADSIEDVKKLDLNERVQRILLPRIAEFIEWKKLSEQELRKRFNIEKNYLKSQVNLLQLYSRWVKPYLKSAAQLEMKDSDRNPALVTAFSTIWLELTLLGKNPINFEEAQLEKKMPKNVKKPKRDYYAVLVADFKFRGIPQKTGQHFTLGGRVTFSLKSYALNNEELKILDQEIKKSDLNDVLKLIEGGTTESLEELKKDIDYFLNKKEEQEEKSEKSGSQNPFSALFSFKKKEGEKSEKKEKEISIKEIKKDSHIESIMRALAKESAGDLCFNVYDVYKKAHGMASHDNPYEK